METAGDLTDRVQALDDVAAVNVGAHFWLSKALVPAMVEHGGGSIVSIASAAGVAGGGGPTRRRSTRRWA